EDAWCADEDFARFADAKLDTCKRMADGMKTDGAVALGRGQRAGLALPIELLQIQAEAAEIKEGVLADRLARRIAALRAGQAQMIFDRAIDQSFAGRIPKAR